MLPPHSPPPPPAGRRLPPADRRLPPPSLDLPQAGAQLRDLVSIGSSAAQQAVFQAKATNPRWAPNTSRLPDGWAEFVACHCACLAALQEGRRVEAYEKAVAALQPFLKVRRGGGGGGCGGDSWLLGW